MESQQSSQVNYLPLTEGLSLFGISRTRGFELTRAGLIETFCIGKRRYVMIDSLRTLPERAQGWTRKKQATIDDATAADATSDAA